MRTLALFALMLLAASTSDPIVDMLGWRLWLAEPPIATPVPGAPVTAPRAPPPAAPEQHCCKPYVGLATFTVNTYHTF
jgi:hypothetical protein